MCNNNCGCGSLFGGDSCTWILVLCILFLVFCGGCNVCGNTRSGCGCDNGCGC